MSTIPDSEVTEGDPGDSGFFQVHAPDSTTSLWIVETEDAAAAVAATEPDAAVWCLAEPGEIPDDPAPVDGQKVVIFPAGDTTDYTVYEAARDLGLACEFECAKEVRFALLPSVPLTEQLQGRSLARQRRWLETVARKAHTKPNKTKPKQPTAAQQSAKQRLAETKRKAKEDGRPVIDVNDDRQELLQQLAEAMQNGPRGDRIFNLGGKLAHVCVNEEGTTVAEFLDDQELLNILTESARTVSVNQRGVNDAWPDSKTLTALYGQYRHFPRLRGIAPSPVLRADGTIAASEGYDEASGLLLDLAGLDLKIPDNPTEDEVRASRSLILDEWLGDFPFASPASRANMLGFILTYPLRELVSLVPLATITAKSKGTGKSKLMGLPVQLYTRSNPEWDALPEDDDETRKQITTLLLDAPAFLCFDESPRIAGRAINRLLTASAWSDRRLGRSERVALPNRAVMAASGNNVEVIGDSARRYYPIELYYDGPNPEDRPSSDFRHPDLEAWTEEHRAELLTAIFTLIRAWQVAGAPKRSTSFGSFERWEAVIGGVLEVAGVEGFLDNLVEHRESTDYDETLWIGHLRWLAEWFGLLGQFTTSDVVRNANAKTDPVLPPSLADLDPSIPGYAVRLGRLYYERDGGWCGGFRIAKLDKKINNKTVWRIDVSLDRAREILADLTARGAAKQVAQAWEDLVERLEQKAGVTP